jgi:hypothetical protein
MQAQAEPTAADFFASRAGVCVYVRVAGRAIRVRFASTDAQGSVAEALPAADAEQAVKVARAALDKYRDALAPLFEKVARGQT